MAIIVATTLSAAVAETADVITVASATGITAPGPNKSARTIVWVDREAMEVVALNSTVLSVVRGVLGTMRVAHSSGQRVWAAGEQDFEHFQGKGMGTYGSLGRSFFTTVPSTAIDTATLTAAQVLSGLITGTPTAAATYTLPTPDLLIAALRSFAVPWIGMSFEFTIKNTSGGANTITVAVPTNGTITGTATIAQNSAKRFLVVMTAVEGTVTYTVFSLGTVVF